ncbi:MAG: glycogen synthase [Deltaproteobacteria bacterium]|nr:glycogen synthase [Deltaproteobacteria bacterium]
MRILFVASECAPFSKVGGLGDVVGSLPKALKAQGHDVRVLTPRYGFIPGHMFELHSAPLGVPLGHGEIWCGILESRLPDSDVPVYFLRNDEHFGGTDVYLGWGGDLFGLARFALLSRAGFQLSRSLNWIPDIIHLHDWPTAPAAIMLNTVERFAPFDRTASVFTIHNMAHQPRFPKEGIEVMQVGWSEYKPDGLEDFGELNPFKAGLYHANMLTTVSPRYAWEIRTPEGGAGLSHVVEFRAADLVGILNGIDEDVWNPETDRYLPAHFDAHDLSGKARCKTALQKELGLQVRPSVPLIGVISRWTAQKGTDIIASALDRLLELDVQIVMLGSGDPQLEAHLRHRSRFGGGSFCAWVGYNEPLAHRVEAASDLFLMPSRFEPCGLNQLYSQRYGTLPIVRSTGGLDDTVEQCQPLTGAGTGFKLYHLSPDSLVDTVAWAVSVYRDKPDLFRAMQVRAMKKRQGWSVAAKAYLDVYDWALQRKRA